MKRIREPNWNNMPADATHVGECHASYGEVTHYCFYKYDGSNYYYSYDDLSGIYWGKGCDVKPAHPPVTIEEMKQKITDEKNIVTVKIVREDNVSIQEFVNEFLTNITFDLIRNNIVFWSNNDPSIIIKKGEDCIFDRLDRKDIIRFLTEKLSKKG